MKTDPERDFPEDFPHENGNYFNRCIHCSQTFRGHKRRVSCKICSDAAKARWEAMTPEEKRDAMTEAAVSLAEFFARKNP